MGNVLKPFLPTRVYTYELAVGDRMWVLGWCTLLDKRLRPCPTHPGVFLWKLTLDTPQGKLALLTTPQSIWRIDAQRSS